MNIYCRVELKLRELESKLLLGISAAARGHTVFLGNIAHLTRLAKRGLIAPGVFHTKDIAPEKEKKNWNEIFRSKGFCITSLDEESGVLGSSYETFGKHRFSKEMIDSVDKVFCWGEKDYNGLKKMFPECSEKFILTGSPRIDFCRPELAKYFEPSATDAFTGGRPYILFASNFGSTNGFSPLWKQLEFSRASGRFVGMDDPDEFRVYSLFSRRMEMMAHYVRAIRLLAVKFPDHCVVIRPHPAESPEAWRGYIGELSNVLVVKDLSIAHWIRKAKVIFQHGCTTALEAAVVGVPIINFEPSEAPYSREQVYYPLLVGQEIRTADGLVETVGKIIRGEWDQTSEKSHNAPVIAELYHALDGQLASERAIDFWESFSQGKRMKEANWTLVKWQICFWDYVRRPLAALFRKLGLFHQSKYDFSHKFQNLSQSELADFSRRAKSLRKEWSDVRVEKIGRNSVLIRPPVR